MAEIKPIPCSVFWLSVKGSIVVLFREKELVLIEFFFIVYKNS